jgi:putative restriction endonuclease
MDFLKFTSSLKINNGKLHRPALLLALAKTIGEGNYLSNVIKPSNEELISNYDIFWKLLVGADDSKFHYPFFALGKTNFWTLIPEPGYEEYVLKTDSLRSFKELIAVVQAVEIDADLFNLLKDSQANYQFVHDIYAKYIPSSHFQLGLFDKAIEERTINNFEDLLKPINEFESRFIIKESDTSLIYVRNADFKRLIPKLYNYRCAISKQGMKYGSSISVEACHLEPFSKRHLCALYNGISLSPEFHKLFDQHFLTFDESYHVVMSSQINDVSEQPYYKQFHGQRLALPSDQRCWPSQELLAEHREKFNS